MHGILSTSCRRPTPPCRQVAGEEELSAMLAVLERREAELGSELDSLEHDLANGADLAERAALEAKFQELCAAEAALMEELAALKQAEA